MTYTVAVRTLCEFTAKRGDLDLRFTPSPDANEGRAGHLAIAARRAPGYETEIALSGSFCELTVRGGSRSSRPIAAISTRCARTSARCTGRSCACTAG